MGYEAALNGHGVDFAKIAQERSQLEAMLTAALQSAMDNPHTITRTQISAIGVKHEQDEVVLCIASPDGRRIDIPLAPASIDAVIRGLRPLEAEVEQFESD